jgi:SAM-dependent methyltransferase
MTSRAWRRWRQQIDLDDYDARWERMAAAGEAVHGEADLLAGFEPASVLDAGCGTGRVAIELARRGVEVVGVDADADMLDRARRKAPDIEWVVADLATLDLGRTFDIVVLAGNVLPFVEPADRPAAVQGCARHLAGGGRLVSGAGLQHGWPTTDELDRWSTDAGLDLEARFGGWAREPWTPGGGYAVTVSRRRDPAR